MDINLALNVLFAWVSVALVFLATVIWALRILIKKKIIKPKSFLGRANRALRTVHIGIGIAFAVTSVLHAWFSSMAIFSLNYGSLLILLAVLLAAMYLIKKHVQRKAWLFAHRVLTVMLITLLGIHIYDIGGAPATKQLIQELSGETVVPVESEQLLMLTDEYKSDVSGGTGEVLFTDGVYNGVADGYGEDLTVAVTINDGLIAAINIVSHNEVGERFYMRAMQMIPQAIIGSQSVAVDSISGSTFTSVGIKNAVADALSQAIDTSNTEADLLEVLPTEDLPTISGEHSSDGGGNQRRHNRGGDEDE